MPDDPHSLSPAQRRRRAWLGRGVLLLIVGASLAFDLRAVLLDSRLSGSDTFTPQALSLVEHSLDGGLKGSVGWMTQLGYKGPLAPLLSLPFLLIFGAVPLSTRLVSVLAHALLAWQCFHLARRLSGSAQAGLWAAFLMVTSPTIFGWARLDFHEPLLAVLVLGTLQAMALLPLSRPRQALALGLLFGLGLLTKLAYIVFMVVPGLWLLARRLRHRRSAAMIALALATMAAVAAPWALPNARTIYYNFQMSTSNPEPAWDKLQGYLGVPEAWALLLAGILGALLLARRAPWRLDPASIPAGDATAPRLDRWILILLVGTIVGSTALFAGVFDFWSRYDLPNFPIAALLAGMGLWELGRLLRRRGLPRPLLALGAAALVGPLSVYYVDLNLLPVRGENPRDFFAGMISPDTRPYPALPTTVRALLPHGEQMVILMDRGSNPNRVTGLFQIWWYRGLQFEPLELREAMARAERGEGVSVLMIRGPNDHELSPREPNPPCPSLRSLDAPEHEASEGRRWLMAQKRLRCLRVVIDPDRMAYVAYRIPARQ